MAKKKKHSKKQSANKLSKQEPIKKTTSSKPPKKTRSSSKPPKYEDIMEQYFGKWTWVFLMFLLVGIGAFVFRDFLSLKMVYFFKDIGSDTVNVNYPALMHSLNYGNNPFDIGDWSFYAGMGRAWEQAQIRLPGFFDPVNSFMSLLTNINKNFILYQYAYKEWFKVILGGIVFFFYLRTIELTRYASVIGSVFFAFSGYMIVGGAWHNHSGIVLSGALVLLAFELLFKKNIWWTFPLAVVYTRLPDLYWTIEFLFVYAIFRYIDEHGWNLKGLVTLGGKMIVLGAIGVAFRAPGLLQSINGIVEAPRVSGTSSFVDPLSRHPIFDLENGQTKGPYHYMTIIMRSFSSDLLGNGSNYKGWYNYLEAPLFYCGLLTLLLIPLLFTFLNRTQKIIYAIFLSFWAIILIFPYFRYAFYKFAGDYYKRGLSLFVPITLLFFGMKSLSSIDKTFRVNPFVLIGSLILLLVGLYYPYEFINNQNPIDTNLRGVITIFLLLSAGLIYLLSFKQYKKFAAIALLVTICSEVAYLSNITVNKRVAFSSKEFTAKKGFNDYTIEAVDFIKEQEKDNIFYRVTKDYNSGPSMHGSLNDAMAQGFYGTPYYSSFNQKGYIDFLQGFGIIGTKNEHETRWAPGLRARPLLETLASVKYGLSKNGGKFYKDRGYQKVKEFNDVSVWQNQLYVPLGFAYKNYIPENEFSKLDVNKKDMVAFKAVVVEDSEVSKFAELQKLDVNQLASSYSGGEYSSDAQQLAQTHLSITKHSDNTIGGTINLPSKQLMFFSIPYDEGWKATIDGQSVPVQKVAYGLMGVLVDKGQHDVALRFKVGTTNIGIIILIILFALFLSAIWWWYKSSTNAVIFGSALVIIFILFLLKLTGLTVLFALLTWLVLFEFPLIKQEKVIISD